ncbi:hypothetical protein DFH07DRAFT_1008375 [Mycena maculata]|uniref:Uncharacterized protein n=1 Tax=Mycena maculata TaxID=230809 RepID=A0AAD7HHQ4_9AGAR|nr:hypothetical protein DFH07DRAFT_1008375 [Mycena maculata]
MSSQRAKKRLSGTLRRGRAPPDASSDFNAILDPMAHPTFHPRDAPALFLGVCHAWKDSGYHTFSLDCDKRRENPLARVPQIIRDMARPRAHLPNVTIPAQILGSRARGRRRCCPGFGETTREPGAEFAAGRRIGGQNPAYHVSVRLPTILDHWKCGIRRYPVFLRVTFSACKTGLRPRKRAFSGLGLDLGVDQSPSPADRLASPFVGLASPFARLAEKRACVYFSFPSD